VPKVTSLLCVLVYNTYIMYFFRAAVAIFGDVDFKFHLKEVDAKINLHAWFIDI